MCLNHFHRFPQILHGKVLTFFLTADPHNTDIIDSCPPVYNRHLLISVPMLYSYPFLASSINLTACFVKIYWVYRFQYCKIKLAKLHWQLLVIQEEAFKQMQDKTLNKMQENQKYIKKTAADPASDFGPSGFAAALFRLYFCNCSVPLQLHFSVAAASR